MDAASRDRIAMSLSFLSKKTWHTTNLKNVEQVWLAEKKQEEEQKKLEMWKKAREEERQKAELRELQQEVCELAARCRGRAGVCASEARRARRLETCRRVLSASTSSTRRSSPNLPSTSWASQWSSTRRIRT